MRVLIIKMSSMGDVIHLLPALTDAARAIPGISFDWVVEENFKEIPAFHPFVKKIIPVAWRRWRKNIFASRHEWSVFLKKLREEKYDLIIDAQGLLKSAFIARLARGVRMGFDFQSAREPFSAFYYQKKIAVKKDLHAILRVRQLFGKGLGYDVSDSECDYGLNLDIQSQSANSVLFLHSTTWATKHWPEAYWIELAKKLSALSLQIKLPWGNQAELERAKRIAAAGGHVEILPRLNLVGLAKEISAAKAVIAVDTGLGHLAAALNVPTISLYGPTDPKLTGAKGKSQVHLQSDFSCSPCLSKRCKLKEENFSTNPPCFSTILPEKVVEELKKMLSFCRVD